MAPERIFDCGNTRTCLVPVFAERGHAWGQRPAPHGSQATDLSL